MENKITQAQFIDAVARRLPRTILSSRDVGDVLKSAAEEIVELAKNGISVPFPGPGSGRGGLGTFSPHDAPQRMGRNQKTGETHRISARRVLKFKVSTTVDLNK